MSLCASVPIQQMENLSSRLVQKRLRAGSLRTVLQDPRGQVALHWKCIKNNGVFLIGVKGSLHEPSPFSFPAIFLSHILKSLYSTEKMPVIYLFSANMDVVCYCRYAPQKRFLSPRDWLFSYVSVSLRAETFPSGSSGRGQMRLNKERTEEGDSLKNSLSEWYIKYY